MKKHAILRWISMLLCLTLLVVFLPQSVLGEISEVLNGDGQKKSNVSDEKTESFVLGEVTNERSLTSKTFKLSDGSYLLADYSTPVHFVAEGGKYVDYDNTLVYSKSIESKLDFSGFENAVSDVKIRFANRTNLENLVKLKTGKYEIFMRLVDANENAKVVVSNTSEALKGNDLGSATTLTKLSSGVVYQEILKNADLQYIIQGGSLKETILVKERTANYAFVFELECEGLHPELSKNGEIVFIDVESGEMVFFIPAGHMIDAKGNYSEKVRYALKAVDEKKFTITVIPDEQWLNSKDRAYPVTIDPSFYTGAYKTTQVSDTTAVQEIPNSTHGNDEFLRVGSTGPTRKNRSFIRLDVLPELPTASVIVEATLNLRQLKMQNDWKDFSGNCNAINLAVREVIESWTESSVSWNAQPSVASEIIDYRTVTAANPAESIGTVYSFNITSLMQKWYAEPETNQGVAIYPIKEQSTSNDQHAFTCFYSKNNPYLNNQTTPFFTICYRSIAGLEDCYNYHTQSLNLVSSYINDYTGNLVLIQDLGLEIENFPIVPSLVYNSQYANDNTMFVNGYNMFCGKGWQLSFALTLQNEYGFQGADFSYIDGDGTKHYFELDGDGNYVDEDGLGYSLKQLDLSGVSYYVLDAGDGWNYRFAGSLLDSVEYYEEDAVSPTYSFQFVYDTGKLIRIESETETVLTLGYSGVALQSISDGVRTVTIDGTPASVSSVVIPDDHTYSYVTDGNGLIHSLADGSGKEYRFTYENGKVVSVSEYMNENLSDSVQITYGNRQTGYRTRGCNDVFEPDTDAASDDILTVFQFDNYGRVINVYSKFVNGQEIVSANGVDYAGNALFDHGENNVKAIYRSEFGTVNLLKNPSAENGTEYWTNINGIPENGSDATDGNSFSGLKTFRVVYDSGDCRYQGFEQGVFLSEGKTYTLSAYVKMQNVAGNGGALIGFRNQGASAINRTLLEKSETLKGTTVTDLMNGWRRMVVQYTPLVSGTYYAFIGGYDCGNGNVIYYDAVQLEESTRLGGSSFSGYNYIRNAGFEQGSYAWENCASVGEISQNALIGAQALKISGDAESYRRVMQYSEPIPAGQSFVLSGWAKANSVALNEDGRTFELMAELVYEDISIESEQFHVTFNPDSTEWQYATKSFVPPRNDVRYYVTVYICYDHNCNDAYFDNISLVLGEVTSLADETQTGEESDEEAEDDSAENHDGELVEIDSTHKYQITNGIKYTYTYDSQERIIETVIENVSGSGSTDRFYTSTNYDTESGAIDLEITEEVDERGVSTSYKYYQNQLYEIVDGKGHVNTYTYNAEKLLAKLSQTIGTLEVSNNYTYNSNGDIIGIQHNEGSTETQSYSFVYDVYGNLISIYQGNTALVTYTYHPNNGKLISATYANGFVEGYEYDSVDNLSVVKYNGIVKFRYLFDRNNVLQFVVDEENHTAERYEYDSTGTQIRIVRILNTTKEILLIKEYIYDSNGLLTGYRYIDSDGRMTSYGLTFDESGQIIQATLPNNDRIDYTYDVFDRSTGTTIKKSNGAFITGENYLYLPGSGGANASTHLIGAIEYSDLSRLDYTYDGNGNILTVSKNGLVISRYEYDELDQLIREDDVANGSTSIFLYDYSGNILSKHTLPYWEGCPTSHYMYLLDTAEDVPVYYTYGNSSWGDQLTAYDGIAITYDASGNPLNWRNVESLSWTGRELTYLNNDGGMSGMYFRYNSDGIRTYKSHYDHDTMDMYHVNYVLDGTKIISEHFLHEITGEEYTLEFYYDSNDSPVGFCYNGNDYYYRKNLQGDIVAILDGNGIIVVEYSYDAWGKVVSVAGTLASTIGKINPFRYRGYYYDTETGFYYLINRFYDCISHRFISLDNVFDNNAGPHIGNLFIYCRNNPINLLDPFGKDAIWLQDTNLVLGFGHTGLLLQDANGKWWHFYWGNNRNGIKGKKGNGDILLSYDGRINLCSINDFYNKYYGNRYECMIYLKGDFSKSVRYAKDLSSKGYNFIFDNCMQVSTDVLRKGTFKYNDFEYCAFLLKIRINPIPNVAFTRMLAFHAVVTIWNDTPWYLKWLRISPLVALALY